MVVSILVYGEMMANYQIISNLWIWDTLAYFPTNPYIYIGTLPIVLPFFGLNLGNRLERGYNVNYTDEERITYCAYGEILPSALANVCKRLKEIGIENWRLVKAGKSLQFMLQDWRLNIERLEITFPILHWQSFSRRPLSLNLKNPWKKF